MPKATHTPTTPRLLDDHFIPARVAVEVTMRRPHNPNPEVTGTLLGAMYARGALHHYRVQVGPGLIYLAPPKWLYADLDAIRVSGVWGRHATMAAPESVA